MWLPSTVVAVSSHQVAEHLATLFSVAALFLLCNPDKWRTELQARESKKP